ncbi:hypothetical protein SPRG_10921 [Saprolegnia parasitica CBS 223.65]|uniref:Nucleotide-diphospho-sugar transferase domain-containing protein n=1 Tax=Saprolegnia parasitica (strain CBS 223.65) TaxID=695850 RepID=A0A067BV07_SAPPC|nr:hypothetical protein SPRG_10921 [Saprolegnia parasitica CBS 223.65]KDO22103.1 hypothetical protein SPRG_10921 [Saprolegnia parasitica CBS 223.65]|eukprot:XP_012207143.1 hypothetical protein SPRG_10921 [Saprolegnia parasitica CBS 223.65]
MASRPARSLRLLLLTLLFMALSLLLLYASIVSSPTSEAALRRRHSTSLRSRSDKVAYMLYATDTITACNALIMAKQIRRLGTPASIEIVLLVTNTVADATLTALEADGTLTLRLVSPWVQTNAKHGTWSSSLTKLRVFAYHGFDKVIYLDSDAWLHRNLDHLFDLSDAAIFWAPRAYYRPPPTVASTLLVLRPSSKAFAQLQAAVQTRFATMAAYDMDVLNAMWPDARGVLPSHYVVLNGHLNANLTLDFDSVDARINATFVTHFSSSLDGSYGKPWTVDRHTVQRQPGSHPRFYALFEAYWQSQKLYCPWLHQ